MYDLRLFDSKLLSNAPVRYHVKQFVQDCHKHIVRRWIGVAFDNFSVSVYAILSIETDFYQLHHCPSRK